MVATTVRQRSAGLTRAGTGGWSARAFRVLRLPAELVLTEVEEATRLVHAGAGSVVAQS